MIKFEQHRDSHGAKPTVELPRPVFLGDGDFHTDDQISTFEASSPTPIIVYHQSGFLHRLGEIRELVIKAKPEKKGNHGETPQETLRRLGNEGVDVALFASFDLTPEQVYPAQETINS